jgi:predicted unusual protein kinase regulating ubiquinone biosynthesis (AarF/ABC1/UbiB family)
VICKTPPLAARSEQAISGELNEIFFDYPFQVPDYFALITRALIVLEGIALTGDPDFDLFAASYPYAVTRAMTTFDASDVSALLAQANAAGITPSEMMQARVMHAHMTLPLSFLAFHHFATVRFHPFKCVLYDPPLTHLGVWRDIVVTNKRRQLLCRNLTRLSGV